MNVFCRTLSVIVFILLLAGCDLVAPVEPHYGTYTGSMRDIGVMIAHTPDSADGELKYGDLVQPFYPTIFNRNVTVDTTFAISTLPQGWDDPKTAKHSLPKQQISGLKITGSLSEIDVRIAVYHTYAQVIDSVHVVLNLQRQ